MSYVHLTISERVKIETYLELGFSVRKIAGRLGRQPSAIQALHLFFPLGMFQTATTDRGKEFSCHERIRDTLGLPMYFADPYSSWQRGSNENANGLLREFFPKGTDFGKVSRSEIAQALSSTYRSQEAFVDARITYRQ